jgi:RNA polymerase sigma-70 factor (ECF subfamily)
MNWSAEPRSLPDRATGSALGTMSGDDVEELEVYVKHLTDCQSKLRGYILACIGNYANTADVLQRTNLTLWKKAGEFQRGAKFLPWAYAIARYEILSFLRDHKRDRLVFSEEVAMLMFELEAEEEADANDRQLALRKCLEKLPHRSRELLGQRYDNGNSIRQIANEANRSEVAVKSAFLRIRRSLEKCIESTLKLEAT